MADTLRRLTSTSSFSALQEKLESWLREYHIISCDQNVNRCCDLIELTAKIQGELFTILNLTAAEGRHYGGEDTLRTRLLPWLSNCSLMARSSSSDDTGLQLMQDSMDKDQRIRELSASRDSDAQKLCATRLQLESTRADLFAALEQVEVSKRKLEALDECQRQTRLLRSEVSYLSAEKATLQERLARSGSPSLLPKPGLSSSPPRSESLSRAQLTGPYRRARLLSRFCELYTSERLEAQSALRRHVTDLEMVQKIIFIAVVESFNRAKRAFRQIKARVRNTLSVAHFGPESVEDAAVDYVVQNMDIYDIQSGIKDVVSAMNVNPRISFPPEVDFFLISSLIREACKAAFAMQTLEPPLDVAPATDGELYDDRKYRRSYDSERTAPLVMYHVWPALVEGDAVVVKGEAVTRRGAVWSRSPSRSSSPTRSRSLSPTRTLAFNSRRSLSPEGLTASCL